MTAIYQSKSKLIFVSIVTLIYVPVMLVVAYLLTIFGIYGEKNGSAWVLAVGIFLFLVIGLSVFSLFRSLKLALKRLPVFVFGKTYFLNNWSKKAYRFSGVSRSDKMHVLPLDVYLRFNNGVSAHYKGDVKSVERYDPSNCPIGVDEWIETNTVRTRTFRWRAFIVFLRAADISSKKLKELIDEHLKLDTENTDLD